MLDTPSQRTPFTFTLLALVMLVIFSATRVEAVNGPFNGKIAFESTVPNFSPPYNYPQIFTMNANGTSLVNISNNSAADNEPAWSPDGTRIAFWSFRDGYYFSQIYVMNADGSGQTRLTNNSFHDRQPTWSPDGNKIAFISARDSSTASSDIYVMNVDGTGQTRLTTNLSGDDQPSWSPDGTKIIFRSFRDGHPEIYVMNADGTGQTRLTYNNAAEESPSFSPDGTKILFGSSPNSQVFVMNANGTNPVQLTSSGTNQSPAFSPDGEKITFTSSRDGNPEIYVMNADGSNQTRTSNSPNVDLDSAWQPIPKLDTIGVFRPSTGQFLLRNFNSAGAPNLTITFGQANDQPLAGDWNGNGVDNVGVFRNGQFILRQPRAFGFGGSTITVNFGQAGDLAIVGDWNGDGIDTPGVFRPSTGQFLLTNGPNTNNSSPAASIISFNGQTGDKPVAGDWNGDGVDTVGLYRESAACAFLLTNNHFSINIIATGFCAGHPLAPITADWNGNGVDTLGAYTIPQGVFSLSNRLTGPPEFQIAFGQPGDLPVAGDWNGGNVPTEP